MAELKPRLIITSPGRKRRGFGTFFILLVIFALGFYAGSKYGAYFFGTEAPDVTAEKGSRNITDEEEQLSGNQEVSGQENVDILQSGKAQGVEDQKSFVDTDFLGSESLEDSSSFQSPDPAGADQSPLVSDNKGDNGALVSEVKNNLTTQVENESTPELQEPADPPASSYTLQVGAFSTPEEAQSIADGYKSKGYKAYVVPIENSRGEKWNLVKIGTFQTIDQAWSYSAYLKNREGLDVYVESLDQGEVFNESWGQQGASDQP